MSTFDAETFLSTQTTEKLSSHYTPIPEGEYQAMIDNVAVRQPKEGMVVLDITYAILDDNIKSELGLEKPTVRQSIFLDMAPSGGLALGPNRNVKLGKVREAAGQNTGKPWAPAMLTGAGPMLVKVKHRVDQDDPDTIYTDVARVAPVR